jgi:hypothetical protein
MCSVSTQQSQKDGVRAREQDCEATLSKQYSQSLSIETQATNPDTVLDARCVPAVSVYLK